MTATPTNRTGRIRPQAVLALVVATILPVLAADRPSTARSSSDDATAAERTAVDDAPGAGSFDVDAVAEDAIGDIESYWSTTFPANFDRPWPPIEGGLHPTDATDVAEHRPPCLVRSTEIVANSYYCEAADALVWDRAMLLDAAAEHGTAGVAAILAHESGHRVHMLLGVDEQAARADPDRYPLALTESMADCHAGAYFRWSVDGGGELRFDGSEVDRAVLALARAHDPVGAEKRTHGGALDRVLAFQRGYAEGVHRCAASTVDELGPATDPQAAPVPHRQLPDLVSDDLAGYFVELAPPGSGQDGPATRLPTGEPGCADAQGAVALCPEEPVVAIDSYEAVAGCTRGSATTPPRPSSQAGMHWPRSVDSACRWTMRTPAAARFAWSVRGRPMPLPAKVRRCRIPPGNPMAGGDPAISTRRCCCCSPTTGRPAMSTASAIAAAGNG